MSDLVPVIPNRELWFVQVPDSWNCLGLEQDVRCWVEVLSHIVFLRFQSKPTIWSRTSEYTRYVLDEIKQWPDTFWSHLYPMHGSTLIIADILFLSTSILRAADPVLRVPSGQTHTKNLSTHLGKEVKMHEWWIWLHLLDIFYDVPPSYHHFLRFILWRLRYCWLCLFLKNILNISFLTDSHIGLPRSVLSEAAGRDLPDTDAEEQRQRQHLLVGGCHHSVCRPCHSASHLSSLLDPGPELSQRNRKYCFCHSFIFWQTKPNLLCVPKFLLLLSILF